jgi:2-polyprenyl-3-methyl-5-hydroxy-6-metoxy-1,4-benzoquinol methylase
MYAGEKWKVGDRVSLWYLDYNEIWRVVDIETKLVDPEEIRCTSRTEDFSVREQYDKYMSSVKSVALTKRIGEDGQVNKPVFCVKHTSGSEIDHGLLDGELEETRVVDGHHRVLVARKLGFEELPAEIFTLEREVELNKVINEVRRMNHAHNPWNHSINLGNGVTTPGSYKPTIDQKWGVVAQCLSWPLEGKKVLDLGCCEGGISIKMAQHGAAEVTGVEMEPERIERGNFCFKTLGLQDKVSIVESNVDAYLAAAEPEQFDIVIALSIIHHITDKEEFFNRVLRILKPGGYLVLESRGPNHEKEEVRANGRISVGLVRRWYSEARTDGGFYAFDVRSIHNTGTGGGDFKWWTVATKRSV